MTKKEKDWQKIKDEIAFDTESGASEDEGGEKVNGLDHPSYEDLEEKLTVAEQKAHDNWEKLVRSMAEVDNIRRRAERDIANAHRYALDKFVNTLLPVADSLEHAIALTLKQQDNAMHEGLDITMKLLLGALEKAEVKPIDPLGQAFDPQLHEAMSIQENNEVAPNTVLVVFQKGYLLNDRMIRPARVVVSKEKPRDDLK
jgi:molecular chaperone GrpE